MRELAARDFVPDVIRVQNAVRPDRDDREKRERIDGRTQLDVNQVAKLRVRDEDAEQ